MTNKSLHNYIHQKEILLMVLFLFSFQVFSQKTYHKIFYTNGNIKEEGWLQNDKKINYWKFYYKNGTLKKEGHFKNNLQTKYWCFYRKDASKEKEGHFINGKQNKWWLFYDTNGNVNHKCQLKNNQKNGFCLLYKNQQLIKAVKFKNGKKLKEWDNLSSFAKDNNVSDLK